MMERGDQLGGAGWRGCVGTQSNKTRDRSKGLTAHELDAAGHPADCARDEVGDAAAHQGGEPHQQQEAAAHSGHHRGDPPRQAGDAVEGGVPSALLQHDGGVALLVSHRVGAAAEGAKGHGLVHLRSQQPVGHEEAHAGGGGAQQGQQGPDHARARQAGRHGTTAGERFTQSLT